MQISYTLLPVTPRLSHQREPIAVLSSRAIIPWRRALVSISYPRLPIAYDTAISLVLHIIYVQCTSATISYPLFTLATKLYVENKRPLLPCVYRIRVILRSALEWSSWRTVRLTGYCEKKQRNDLPPKAENQRRTCPSFEIIAILWYP